LFNSKKNEGYNNRRTGKTGTVTGVKRHYTGLLYVPEDVKLPYALLFVVKTLNRETKIDCVFTDPEFSILKTSLFQGATMLF